LKEFQTLLPVCLTHLQQILLPLKIFVKDVVTKADLSGIVTVAPIIYFGDIGPEYPAQTHGTGLCCGVELAPGQIVTAQVPAGVPNRFHLSMAGGVVVKNDTIMSSPYDLSVFDYHRTEGASMPLSDALIGFCQCLSHKIHFFFLYCVPDITGTSR
jgi:hypothetical protein